MSPAAPPEVFVRAFREAAPWVHAFRGRTFVVAFPGEVVAARGFAGFVHDLNLLAALGIRLVLVSGSRPQIEAELRARGRRSRYHRGLRVTDADSLAAVKRAAGMLRVEVEARLSQGLPDSPMAGAALRVASGNFISARPIGVVDGVDYQFTGVVRKVDAAAIARRLDAGEVALIPHLGYSPTGEVFNLAWEDVAVSVAGALGADKLVLLADLLPAGRDGRPLAELTAARAGELAKKPGLAPELAKMLRCARDAVGAGVARAHLVSRRVDGATLLELFTSEGVGTMVTAQRLDVLRPARIEDVRGILALIEPLEADGTLVKRSRERLEAEIGNFLVAEHDGTIVGCAALYAMPGGGELACLAVSPAAREGGLGEQLLHAIEERGRGLRMRRLYALSTRAGHWFLAQGFRETGVRALPRVRRALYNWQRNSKVFMKAL